MVSTILTKVFNTSVSVKEGASRSVLRGIIQYDTLNEVNVRLSDGSKAFDYSGHDNIIFKVLKADGTTYIDAEGVRVMATSPEDGIVTLILAGQATTAAGLCQSVIEIYSAGEKMTTARFNYEVFGALEVDEDATMSEPEYPALQNLMKDLSALEAAIEGAEAQRETAEEERVAAEEARKEAEERREDLEAGYVAQAKEARDEARRARDAAKDSERIADNRAQETSVDRAIVEQLCVETRGYVADAEESARQAATSAVEAKAGETVVLNAKAVAEKSASDAKASETAATRAAAQATEGATIVESGIATAVESAESAEHAEMLAERWASTAKGWSEGGQVVTGVREDSEGRTVFTVADAYGAKQYAADAAASAASIVQYETDLGAAVRSAQASATEAKGAEDAAVAAKVAAEKARDEAQAVSGGDFANSAYVDNKAAEAVTQANEYTDNELWDHNYSTSAHGDIRGRIYNVEKTRPLIVTVAKDDNGVYQADQYMEDIARAGNNGRVVIAVVATYGVDGDAGKPIDYDLYYMTDCAIVNRGVAAFTVNEIRFRNANGGEILITSDDMAEVIETTVDVSGQIGDHNVSAAAHSDIRATVSNAAAAASTAQSAADNHIANKDNPHGVTAGQIGAVSLTGGENISGEKRFKDHIALDGGKTFNFVGAGGLSSGYSGINSSGITYYRSGKQFEINYNSGSFYKKGYTTTLPDKDGTLATLDDIYENAVAKTGDTMTGALTLSGYPYEDNHAATKAYVDDQTGTKATTETYTTSVGTTWTANTQTISVAGILATDNPIVDVVLGADADANAAYLEAWGKVTRIVTADGSVTLYATDAPGTAFTIQLKVVR